MNLFLSMNYKKCKYLIEIKNTFYLRACICLVIKYFTSTLFSVSAWFCGQRRNLQLSHTRTDKHFYLTRLQSLVVSLHRYWNYSNYLPSWLATMFFYSKRKWISKQIAFILLSISLYLLLNWQGKVIQFAHMPWHLYAQNPLKNQ